MKHTLEYLRKEAPHTLADQSISKRSKMHCKNCRNTGIEYPKYISLVGYGGSGGENGQSVCSKCYGLSCSTFFSVESGGGYFHPKAQPLW